MLWNVYFIAAIVVFLVMLTVGIFSRGRKVLLPAFFLIEAIFVMLFLVFDLDGFEIAWILAFPYIAAFLSLALFFRVTGTFRISLLVFACLCAGLAFGLNTSLIIRNVLEDPNQIYNLNTFGKYLFLVAGALIVALSGALALLIGLAILIVQRISKRKGKAA